MVQGVVQAVARQLPPWRIDALGYDDHVIVVGAGIIGLASAWYLSRRGVDVSVFDTREAGREASWAGAGMLAPGGEVEADSEAARMAVRSLAAFPRFVEELTGESGVSIDFRLCGAIDVAFQAEEVAALESRAVVQESIGIASLPVAHPGAVYARHYPNDAAVDPRDVTAALRAALLRRGASLHENERVLEVCPDGRVRTDRACYREDGVLIAAGAWLSDLLSTLAPSLPRTMPVRGHLLSYAPGIAVPGPILRHGHTYLVQRSDGRVIAGSSTEHVGFDRNLDEMVIASIESRAAQLMPALSSLRPKERWNGFRPGIEGGAPFVGRIGDRIWGAFGHYRNGILMTPETARMVSDMVVG